MTYFGCNFITLYDTLILWMILYYSPTVAPRPHLFGEGFFTPSWNALTRMSFKVGDLGYTLQVQLKGQCVT